MKLYSFSETRDGARTALPDDADRVRLVLGGGYFDITVKGRGLNIRASHGPIHIEPEVSNTINVWIGEY